MKASEEDIAQVKHLTKLIEEFKVDLDAGTMAHSESRSRLEEIETLADYLRFKFKIDP